jgi:hypothetical protein
MVTMSDQLRGPGSIQMMLTVRKFSRIYILSGNQFAIFVVQANNIAPRWFADQWVCGLAWTFSIQSCPRLRRAESTQRESGQS